MLADLTVHAPGTWRRVIKIEEPAGDFTRLLPSTTWGNRAYFLPSTATRNRGHRPDHARGQGVFTIW